MTGTAVRVHARAPERRHMRAFALAQRTPPDEIQLWHAGDNPTDFGVHRWTDRSQREVMARYEERGNPLLIDVEHNGAALQGAPMPTAGYAKLEPRAGEPWLVFSWSAYGAEQIASGQRRFLSPEYDIDPDTNEITALYRVSLVADPATHNARVLASAQETRSMPDPNLVAIQAVLESTDDPATAIDAIRALLAKLAENGDGGGDAPPATDDAPPAFAGADPPATDDDKKKNAPPFAAKTPAGGEQKPAATSPEKPAGTPPAIAPVTPPSPITAAVPIGDPEATRAVREAAVRSENALRDMLLEKHGARLQPSIRQWASAQPLKVVQSLLAAAPAELAPPARVTATRGAGQGTGPGARRGLEGPELEHLKRGLGTFKASADPMPHRNEAGELVFPATPPSEARRIMAAEAAKKGGGDR